MRDPNSAKTFRRTRTVTAGSLSHTHMYVHTHTHTHTHLEAFSDVPGQVSLATPTWAMNNDILVSMHLSGQNQSHDGHMTRGKVPQ